VASLDLLTVFPVSYPLFLPSSLFFVFFFLVDTSFWFQGTKSLFFAVLLAVRGALFGHVDASFSFFFLLYFLPLEIQFFPHLVD